MSSAELVTVARWQTHRIDAALASLPGSVDRLTGWRIRLEALGREIGATARWAGAAARSGSGAVVELATAADRVACGLRRSADALAEVGVHAVAAQEAAAEALRLATAAEVELAGGAVVARPPNPTPTMAPDQAGELMHRASLAAQAAAAAREALRRRALVAAAAAEADEALRSLGETSTGTPPSFSDLAVAIHLYAPVATPPAPRGGSQGGRSPDDVARWWSGLSAAAQLVAIADEPDRIGGLDGVPAWARDRANRLVLARLLDRPLDPAHPLAVTVAARLAAEEASGKPVGLYELDPRHDLVAVAIGDPDTAGAVGVLVPGILTTPEDDLDGLLADAAGVRDAATAAAPGLAVATLAWLGYRTPQNLLTAALPVAAVHGGAALARTLDGLAAVRTATGSARPRTTVVAHSYGAVVAHAAAHRPGRLAADAVVLLGSPGEGIDGARGLEAPEAYQASAPDDEVAHLGWFGESPWQAGYGAVALPADRGTGHTGYYDQRHPTLAALGAVVAGTRRPR